jgi:drug/metabolite transporter (DMT)-like permease
MPEARFYSPVRHRLPPDLLLLVTVLFWSFNFVAVKYALDHGFETLAFGSLRFALAAAVFGAFTVSREGDLRIRRSDLALVVGLCGLGMAVNQLSFVGAVELTSSVATVALLFGTLPIWVALIASLFGVERLRPRHWVATLVSFGGVALVASGSSGELGGDLGGILLALVAAATWAAYSVAVGPLMRRYSPYRISAVVLIAGCVPLVAASLPDLARQDWGAITPLAWAALLYAMLLSLVVTNILWFTAIERVGAARSSLYANLQPFLGAFFAFLVLGEGLSASQLAGGAVIAAGIVLARRPEPTAARVD